MTWVYLNLIIFCLHNSFASAGVGVQQGSEVLKFLEMGKGRPIMVDCLWNVCVCVCVGGGGGLNPTTDYVAFLCNSLLIECVFVADNADKRLADYC